MRAAAPGREEQPERSEREKGVPRTSPRPKPNRPLPPRHSLAQKESGSGARMRTGALRQPPALPEAARTGRIRLEPAVPAREPAPHKGRRRLTARVSLRRAGAGSVLVPHPSPSFCPRPASVGRSGLQASRSPQSFPRPWQPEGSGCGAQLDRVEPEWTRPLPPRIPPRPVFRAAALAAWKTVFGKPPAPLFRYSLASPARESESPLCPPGKRDFSQNPCHAVLSFPFSWETPESALEAKLLKLQKNLRFGEEFCFPCNSGLKNSGSGAKPEIIQTLKTQT